MGKEYNRKTIKASGEPYFRVSPLRMFVRFAESVIEGLNYIPGMDEMVVTEYAIETENYRKEKEQREPAELRIVMLSDLHSHRFGAHQERLGEAIQGMAPDLILVAGDWVRINYEDIDARAVRDAARVLGAIAPVYSSLGNHEIHAFGRTKMIRDLKELGVTFLENETQMLDFHGRTVALTGLTTRYGYYFGRNRERRRKEIRGMLKELKTAMMTGAGEAEGSLVPPLKQDGTDDVVRIVIAHRPELFRMYVKAHMDLVLTGHAHGGLLRLGKNLRLLAPDQGFFPRYVRGVFTKERTSMVISEGLGGPRLGIHPEIVVINLKY